MSINYKKEAKALNHQADKLYKDGLYKDAIKLYIESVKLMRQAGKPKVAEKYQDELNKTVMRRSEEINHEADNLLKEGKYEQAVKVYEDAYDLLEQAGQKWLYKKGDHYLKELNKAREKYAEKLKDDAEKLIKDKDWEAAVEIFETILKTISPEIDQKFYEKIRDISSCNFIF